MPKIMLDAGHYGNYYNKGVIDGYYESNMTWTLQGYLKTELEAYGFTVNTTRVSKAEDVPVVNRGALSMGHDLFVSLHSNAASTEAPDYVAVFYLSEDKTTRADEVSKVLAKKLAPVIADAMGTAQAPQTLDRPVDFDRDGDGQLNDNYYGVLHGADLANTPGVIIEHSFHTNKKACEWLMKTENLKLLAKREAAVIAEFFGLKKAEEKVEEEANEKAQGYYSVICGSYENKSNAEAMLANLEAAGFKAFIKHFGE